MVWEDGQKAKGRQKIPHSNGGRGQRFCQHAGSRHATIWRHGRPGTAGSHLIDGGLGRLSAAIEGLKHVGQEQIPIIGLAKARGEKDERIFLRAKIPSSCDRPRPPTHLVQRIRTKPTVSRSPYHRNLRGKALLSSELDQIVGIGKIRRKRLLKLFGSVQHIAAATDDQLKTAGLDQTATVAALRKALTPA